MQPLGVTVDRVLLGLRLRLQFHANTSCEHLHEAGAVCLPQGAMLNQHEDLLQKTFHRLDQGRAGHAGERMHTTQTGCTPPMLLLVEVWPQHLAQVFTLPLP
ncbi:hypothetical protein GALL_545830 [mine drainage metagenome]|uniref:Uncharacterized protein n=1 Tax=mine drainage metagenome TaxID=410659 RepID=A0A1J5NXA0_9ZZZZ